MFRGLLEALSRERALAWSRDKSGLFREGDTPRARLYVSRRLRSEALVYVVAPLRTDVGTQECTQIGENGLSAQPPPACRARLLVRPARKVRFSVRWRVQTALLREAVCAECAFA